MDIREVLDNIVTEEQLQQLYEVFLSINDFELPIVRHTIYPGSSLIRQRVNQRGRFFKHISELSYPPATVVLMERANLPGRPITSSLRVTGILRFSMRTSP